MEIFKRVVLMIAVLTFIPACGTQQSSLLRKDGAARVSLTSIGGSSSLQGTWTTGCITSAYLTSSRTLTITGALVELRNNMFDGPNCSGTNSMAGIPPLDKTIVSVSGQTYGLIDGNVAESDGDVASEQLIFNGTTVQFEGNTFTRVR